MSTVEDIKRNLICEKMYEDAEMIIHFLERAKQSVNLMPYADKDELNNFYQVSFARIKKAFEALEVFEMKYIK